MSDAVYRFTIFTRDGITPWFGTYVAGAVTVADFQTPDATLTHARPYLRVPEGFSPSEVDFLNGSSRIGTGSVGVMDKRITAADQTTGLVTSRIKEAPGSRAILERWIDDGDYSEWRVLLDGVVSSYTVDADELLVYWFHLRDAREFEREQPLFKSNHVLFGAGGASGPAIDYGRMPGGTFLVPAAVEPYETTFTLGLGSGAGLFWGMADGPLDGFGHMGQLGNATQDADGLWRHKDFRIAWRALGSSDPYTIIENMPRPFGAGHAVQFANHALPGLDWSSPYFRNVTTLYFGSEVEADIPTDGQDIELLIYAVEITKETPFWWDGGTLGDLLQEIVAGDHTDEPPKERYDTAALAAFALSSRPARMKLTAPVPDRRKWVEENIYKASFTAPAFNVDKELYPAAWRTPTVAELAGAPVLDAVTIQPIGEYEHGTDNAVGAVEFTYIRESLESLKTMMAEGDSPWWNFFDSPDEVAVADPTDTRLRWQLLVETPVTVLIADPDATPGAQKLTYAPVTIRSIARAEGVPDGGDTQDELGNQLTQEASGVVFPRFRTGAPKYKADVSATPANLDLYEGQWVWVRFAPLPNYSTGKRGLSRYMQIYAITDIDPSTRRVFVVDGDAQALDVTNDPDIVGTEDCLTGGTSEFVPSGRASRAFTVDGNLTNTCGHAVTLKKVLLIGGGGGGGISIGGGAGAGGVLIAENVLIAAGAVIPITIGVGGVSGSPSTDGGDSVLWVAPDGTALDPLTDPPPAGLIATGGGAGGGSGGNGNPGGSGGGGGAELPGSGGGVHNSGAGTIGQGNDGGDGGDAGGLATCRAAAGGGGGSYAAPGEPGVASFGSPAGGAGGAMTPLTEWGVSAGAGGTGGSANKPGALGAGICGPEFYVPGASGGLYGGGGGGGGDGAGFAGSDGIVLVQYVALAPELAPPVITTTEVTDENQVRVCIEEADWPVVGLDGYQVRVEYAVGAVEPDAASGDWRFAGVLTAPGCVTSVAVPTGATVWTRAIAEATNFPPSEPSTAGDEPTPEIPGLLAAQLTLDDDGLGTATWEPNAFAFGVRVRGKIHALAASTARPLPFLADVEAVDGTYSIAGVVPEGDFETLDLETWSVWGPDAAVPVALEDSYVSRNSPVCNGVWATVRDSAGSEVQRTLGTIDVRIKECNTTNQFQGIYRGILTWNCSTYDPTAVAVSAVLTLRVLAKTETLAGQSVCLVGATPATPGTHVAADYGQLGATLFSADVRTLASLTVDTYVSFTLNAAGLAAVQAAVTAGGIVSLGLRIESDRTNTAPTWGSNQDAKLQVASLDHATSAFRPVLAVTTGPLVGGTLGRIYRLSVRRPVRTIARVTDVIDPTLGGTGLTAYVLGDTIYADAVDQLAVLPGNITATRKFLRQTGTGAVSAAPAWDTVAYSDLTGAVPTWNQNTTGSAATLTTTRTIWGQNFNGSANVSGAFSGATTGNFTGTVTVNGTTVDSNTVINNNLTVGNNLFAASFVDKISTTEGMWFSGSRTWIGRSTAAGSFISGGYNLDTIIKPLRNGTGVGLGDVGIEVNSARALTVSNIDGSTKVLNNLSIGNSLNAVSPTAPNRTITMIVGGTTVYISAKTTND